MKSIQKLDETPCDMALASFIPESFSTTGTTASTGSNSNAKNDLLHIKFSVALSGLNRLGMQSVHPDVAMLANVFHTIFNFNWH